MRTRMYLAPGAPAKFSYSGLTYVAGAKPEPIVEEYTSATPGFLHIGLANGKALTVETGKGYLLSIAEVEGQQ